MANGPMRTLVLIVRMRGAFGKSAFAFFWESKKLRGILLVFLYSRSFSLLRFWGKADETLKNLPKCFIARMAHIQRAHVRAI